MRFKGLDLNLLQALDVLLEERHVSRAADRMNVTQPAMSGALTRLRQYFNDPLLAQHGKRMIPTPHAVSLAPRLKRLLGDVDALVEQLSHFDPATSERVFRVVASDYVVSIIFPALASFLAEQTRGISIEFRNPSERTLEQFDQGEIDLLITPEYMMRSKRYSQHLYNEEQVVIGWSQNPVLRGGEIGLEDFFSAVHVIVELGRARRDSYVETFFKTHERKRRVAMRVSSFLAAPVLVVGTSLLTVTHKSLARYYADNFDITISKLPFEIAPMKQMIACHEARIDDHGVIWLRQQIVQIASGLQNGVPASLRN